MSDLIDRLKNDHEILKNLLSGVYGYIVNDSKKLEFVNKLKDIVANHINTEDKELYPVLNKAAEKDKILKSKLDLFAKDWKEISSFVTYYIEKYSVGNFDEKFTIDTAKLLSSLRQRMIKEEVSLFSEYSNRI